VFEQKQGIDRLLQCRPNNSNSQVEVFKAHLQMRSHEQPEHSSEPMKSAIALMQLLKNGSKASIKLTSKILKPKASQQGLSNWQLRVNNLQTSMREF
jgi:hypothetical protein